MISEATLAQLRDRIDIHVVVGETVRLKRAGRSFVGLCPFHKEKTPSFSVNAERGYYHCFGCKEHGSAIDFVMKLEGKSFPEAVRSLAERFGVEIEETGTEAERREEQAARRAKDDFYAVNALAAVFYEHCLHGGPGLPKHPLAPSAVDELARRGLAPADPAVQAFRIGYAPHGWDALCAFLQKHGVSPVVAESVGLIVPRSSGPGHYDRFRHRLMFPVIDVQGRVIAFSGRELPAPPGERPPTEKPAKYVNSPESPIYTKGQHLFGLYQARQAIRQAGESVLVEGNFDVVSLHARGVQQAIAPLGTAFTAAQAQLLHRFAASTVVLFDGDKAGRDATWGARIPCREAGLSVRAITLPGKTDPDEFIQRAGVEALRQRIVAALPLKQHLLQRLLKQDERQGGMVTDQLERVRLAIQLIAEETDPIERELTKAYADQLAPAIMVNGQAPTSLRQLEAALGRAVRSARTAPPLSPEVRVSAEETSARAILGALLDYPGLLTDPDLHPALDVLDGDAALLLLVMRQESDLASALQACPASLRSMVAGRIARPFFETAADAKADVLRHAQVLGRLRTQRSHIDLHDQVRRLSTSGRTNAAKTAIERATRR